MEEKEPNQFTCKGQVARSYGLKRHAIIIYVIDFIILLLESIILFYYYL